MKKRRKQVLRYRLRSVRYGHRREKTYKIGKKASSDMKRKSKGKRDKRDRRKSKKKEGKHIKENNGNIQKLFKRIFNIFS